MTLHKLKLLLPKLVLLTAITLFAVVGLQTRTVSAATAGCYTRDDAGAITGGAAACADAPTGSAASNAVTDNLCYMRGLAHPGFTAYAVTSCDTITTTAAPSGPLNTGAYQASNAHQCGGGTGNEPINTSLDIGCRGKGNPIIDLLFAVIRFLSYGVGLVIIGSMIVAGIQYSTSRGDPQATAKAMKRIYSTIGALALFIFGYALLNWLIPGQILK